MLEAAASFSTPADPIAATTQGPGPGSGAAAEARPEGEQGEGRGEHPEVNAAAAAAGGRRWMNSAPQDQSATRSHSRSSFSSSTLVNTTTPTDHIDPQLIWHLFFFATYIEREAN